MKQCRICQGTDFRPVIDFGETPLVNSLIEEKDLKKKEKTYPLLVEQCQECSLVQIVEPVPTKKIYQDQDYLYYTGDMPTTKQYFGEFVNELEQYLIPNDLVIEIGSNDGTMLGQFEDQRILGVDPSTNVVVRALAKNIPTLSAGFSERVAKNIVQEFGKAKIVGGANCIAHIDDIHSLMRGVKEVLVEDGVFWVECNYWGGMVKNTNYSLIYHDHYSYFSLLNWVILARMYDMQVFDAYVTPAQGGSLRVLIGNRPQTERFKGLIGEEISTNLKEYDTCVSYEKHCREESNKLGNLVRELKKQGKTIAGYGAAAKGFSVIQLA